MCQFCAEVQGLEALAHGLRTGEWPRPKDLPWSVPLFVQEGAPEDIVPPDAAPMSRAALAAERSGAQRAADLPDEHPLAASWASGIAGREPGAALRFLVAYSEWASGIDPFSPLPVRAAAGRALDDAFRALWAAWQIAEQAVPRAGLLQAVRALCVAPPPSSAELLGPWLQRRAVLAWERLEGFGPLVDGYGLRLRPTLVHYVAMRRPPANGQRAALRARMAEFGEELTGAWALD